MLQQDPLVDNKHFVVSLSLGNTLINLNKIKCPQCRKRFDTMEEMEQHRTKHLTENKFKCEICSKEFPSHSSMWKHTKAHTGERLKPFKCPICEKCFTQQANMLKHQLLHTGLKPYKCPVCEKAFTQQANMVKHQMLHTGIKPYKCPTCDKAFAQQANMMKHQMLHTGLKPYKCGTCDKAFAQQANMVKHQMLHTGEKPFKCKSCDKAFSQNANLKKHEMVHLGIRPHTCPLCPKSYSQYSNLKKHLLSHQKQAIKQEQQNGQVMAILYSCQTCKMQFEDIIEFERHTRHCGINSVQQHSVKLENIKSEVDIDGSSNSGMQQHISTTNGGAANGGNGISVSQSQPPTPMHLPSAILTSVISSSVGSNVTAHNLAPTAHSHHGHVTNGGGLLSGIPTGHPHAQQQHSPPSQHNLPIHLQQQLSHHLISSHLPHPQEHGTSGDLHHQVNFHHPHISHLPNISHKILSPLFHIPPFNNNHST
ncbi:zinc finger protein OZF-like [Anopheles marshallii]|uniref:zinc finger protein OZF-like n=1 Tax=Anopheles marshallii TaxID=1521116 RepID=UPI00237A0EF9|nr:zinc finger protein OZF-like [Anopheles marshallii]